MKTQNRFPWDRCPPEIRDIIFDGLDEENDRPYFAWNTRGCTPAFLAAVRRMEGFCITYAQALHRFKILSRSIRMDKSTRHKLKNLVGVELDAFQILDLEIG